MGDFKLIDTMKKACLQIRLWKNRNLIYRMNKNSGFLVLISVSVPRLVLLAGAVLLFASCSGSRTVSADLTVPSGKTVRKTVKGSDILITKGSTLEVFYSSRNRYFVEAGGALVGFKRGVNQTKIYAENGALIPNFKSQNGFTIHTVKDASESYRDRYKELVPKHVTLNSNLMGAAPVIGVGVGVDQELWDDDQNDWGHNDRSSQPTSVRASSYETKD